MQVARIHGRGYIRLHEEERPRPGPGEVLVRVRALGLSGSDLHWYSEESVGEAGVTRPFVLGHEFGGVTEDGRNVALDPAIPCLDCALCHAGHANLCEGVRITTIT